MGCLCRAGDRADRTLRTSAAAADVVVRRGRDALRRRRSVARRREHVRDLSSKHRASGARCGSSGLDHPRESGTVASTMGSSEESPMLLCVRRPGTPYALRSMPSGEDSLSRSCSAPLPKVAHERNQVLRFHARRFGARWIHCHRRGRPSPSRAPDYRPLKRGDLRCACEMGCCQERSAWSS